MSPQRPREVNAKVEGRDPPEPPVKDTMTAFDALTTRLLKVPMSEVVERQRIYEESRDDPRPLKRKKLKVSVTLVEQSLNDSKVPHQQK